MIWLYQIAAKNVFISDLGHELNNNLSFKTICMNYLCWDFLKELFATTLLSLEEKLIAHYSVLVTVVFMDYPKVGLKV